MAVPDPVTTNMSNNQSHGQDEVELTNEEIDSLLNTVTTGAVQWSRMNVDHLNAITKAYEAVAFESDAIGAPRHKYPHRITNYYHTRRTSVYTLKQSTESYFKYTRTSTTPPIRTRNHKVKNIEREGEVTEEWLSYVKHWRAHLDPAAPVQFADLDVAVNPARFYNTAVFGGTSCSPIILALGGVLQCEIPQPLEVTPECEHELEALFKSVDSGSISLITPRPSLQELHSSMKYVTPMFGRFTELLFYLSMELQQVGITDYTALLVLLAALYDLDGPDCEVPGFVFCGYPGTGKTELATSHLGVLEMHYLNRDLIRTDPTLVQKFVAKGFSFVTHEWDFRKWDVVKIIFRPADFAATAQHFAEMAAKIKTARKEFYRRNVGPRNKREQDRSRYEAEFSNVADLDVVYLAVGQTIVDGYLTILHSTFEILE